MSDSIYKSLATIRQIESKQILSEVSAADLDVARKAGDVSTGASLGQLGTKVASKVGSKVLPATSVASKVGGELGKRLIPGLGLVAGGADAYRRAKAGDWIGAGLSAAGGIASTLPGLGTAASLGLAGAQIARDKARTGSFIPDADEIAAAGDATTPNQQPQAQIPAGGDPKVFALQQQLIAKGAKITADGKMGPATQTAMKQFPDVKMAEDNEENKMSESQRIAELMSRLAQLEQAPAQPQVADEGIADLAKSAFQGIKNFGSAAKTGFTNPEYAKVAGMATRGANKGQVVNKAANLGAKTGKALNTGAKVGAGAAAGAAGVAAMQGAAGTKPAAQTAPTKPASSTSKPAAGGGSTQAAGLSADEEQELALLANDMIKLKGQNSELDALIDRHIKLRPEVANGVPGGGPANASQLAAAQGKTPAPAAPQSTFPQTI